MTSTSVLSLADVVAAAKRISGVAHRTPVLTSHTLDRLVGAEVLLKCENFQRVGAFKFRGAYNALARLTPDQLTRGVAAYSSGNHAQAVALAARLFEAPAVILMPQDTPAGKLAATRGYGAEVITYDRYRDDRMALGRSLADERGLALIPPYESPDVMAGQGTVALELLARTGPLDALVVPVGGGGLMAGCATVAAAQCPGIRIVGVEPTEGDDTLRSLKAGVRVSIPVPHTIADGQAINTPGELTFAVNSRLVDEIVLVSEDEIRAAMLFAFERMKIVLEPSGASALAAMLAGHISAGLPSKAGAHPNRIGVVLSGGNISAQRFQEILATPTLVP